MSKPILYYAADCPDTAPFVAELKRLGVMMQKHKAMRAFRHYC